MSRVPAPPVNHHPENIGLRPNSRYRDRRSPIMFWVLLFGFIVGLGGGLFYAWQIDPKKEVDTRPAQLRRDEKASYVVAIALRFAYDSDLNRAVSQLIELDLGADPFQQVAEVACDLAGTGYVDGTAGVRAVRALKTFYQLQGKTGCADVLVVEAQVTQIIEVLVPTATATLPPPPSKTPLPEENPANATPFGVVVVPTTRPLQTFSGRVINTFCSTEFVGVIEIFVQNTAGDGIGGQAVRVRWDGGEDRFITGLKPERGLAYADFVMEAGKSYVVDMPAQSDPINTPLTAGNCTTESGQSSTTSYRVVFRP